MAYFYEFELILAGIILLSAMAFGGVRLWLKKRAELKKTEYFKTQEDKNL